MNYFQKQISINERFVLLPFVGEYHQQFVYYPIELIFVKERLKMPEKIDENQVETKE